MTENDCDYTRPGVTAWWSCCTETSHDHTAATEEHSTTA